MNEIRQYSPAFFSGFENQTVEFETISQLKSIPFVLNFTTTEDFCGFAISRDNNALVAVYKNGTEWWVVGFIKDTNIDLPTWCPNFNPATNKVYTLISI